MAEEIVWVGSGGLSLNVPPLFSMILIPLIYDFVIGLTCAAGLFIFVVDSVNILSHLLLQGEKAHEKQVEEYRRSEYRRNCI